MHLFEMKMISYLERALRVKTVDQLNLYMHYVNFKANKRANHGNLLPGCFPLAPATLNSQWRIIELIWTKGSPWTKMQVNRGKPKPKGKSYKATQSKARRAELTSSTSKYMPKGIIHWPTADLPVHDGCWYFHKWASKGFFIISWYNWIKNTEIRALINT